MHYTFYSALLFKESKTDNKTKNNNNHKDVLKFSKFSPKLWLILLGYASSSPCWATVGDISTLPNYADLAMNAWGIPSTNSTGAPHAQLAYINLLAKQPITDVVNPDPQHEASIRSSVFALSGLNAAELAYQLALKYAYLFPDETLRQLRENKTVARLNDAIAERRRLDESSYFLVRSQPLDAVLVELEENLASFPKESPQYQRVLFDRIFALRMRERMPDAIQAYLKLPAEVQTNAPAYVKRAVADAYLAQRQPKKAAAIYQSLAVNAKNDLPLHMRLHSALIESEDYPSAAKVLAQVKNVSPALFVSMQSGGEPVTNFDRLDLDVAVIMDAADRNSYAKAQSQMESLREKAPRNVDLLNSYSSILRWRGWPEYADQITDLAVAYDPDDIGVWKNIASNAHDLGQIPRWKAATERLMRDFPDDADVQKNYAEWRDRDRWSINTEFSLGHSNSSDHTSDTPNVYGSRDREWQTRLNTPWVMGTWRGFVQQSDRSERWPDQSQPLGVDYAHDNRIGFGAEWASQRSNAWLLLSGQRETGDFFGVSGSWSQWLNDYWQYSLGGAVHSTDVPLRALKAKISGNSGFASIKWQQNESRSAYLSYGLLAIDDGNNRQMLTTGLTQQLAAGPHYITKGGIDLNASRNSKAGGSYYNPKESRGATAHLEHDWTTWRSYDQSLSQNFTVAAAANYEAGVGTDPAIDLGYQHVWQLCRTWKMNYGVNWGSHVYGGQREGRVSGLLGLEGVF